MNVSGAAWGDSRHSIWAFCERIHYMNWLLKGRRERREPWCNLDTLKAVTRRWPMEEFLRSAAQKLICIIAEPAKREDGDGMAPGGSMPRYFFHQRVGDHMMWDETGLDLPELGLTPDADQAAVLWAEVLAGRLHPGRILVITNALGQVLFVSAR